MSSTFYFDVNSYAITTTSSTIKFKATTYYPVKFLLINGVEGTSGLWSQDIDLEMGTTNILIKSRSLDGTANETYSIFVTRIASTTDYSTASSWAVDELEQAQMDKLTTDSVMGNFQQDITRLEFCGLVVKLYEALSGKTAQPLETNPFTDTDDINVLKARHLSIVFGVSANTFAPNDKITRQEICLMLYRTIFYSVNGVNTSTAGVPLFADESQISDWAIEAVRFAYKHGIMKGPGDNSINPLGNTTREQAIILVKRTFETFTNI